MRVHIIAKLKVIPVAALCGWVLATPGRAQPPSPTPGELKWRAPLIGVLSTDPTLGTNGLVYAVGRPGETLLHAWETATGQLRWATNLGQFVGDGRGTLVVGPEGHVYVNTASGVSAIDGETGASLWNSPARGAISVGGDGTVYVAGDDLFALEPTSGTTRWSSFSGPGEFGPPALSASGLLVVPTDPADYRARSIVAFDARNGGAVWKFTPDSPSVSFASVAIAADGTVFASGQSGHLFALDGDTGEKLWSFQGLGEISDMIIAPDGSVCVAYRAQGNLNCAVHVHDGQTGEFQREFALPYAQEPRLALTADGTLYVAPYEFLSSGGPKLLALDFVTGQTNWVFDAPGFHVRSLNVGRDGTIYLESGFLYAIHGSSPLADSPWPKAQQNSHNSSYWTVAGPPQITKQPRSHWAAVDRSTVFHFYSPVARPLHIQWRFNGQPIPDATNESLRIESVRFEDAGNYSVVLSNEFGSALSEEATLSAGYAVEVTALGPGLVRRTPNLDVYPTNSVVELEAITARSNHIFVDWSGDISAAETTITLTLDRNYAVTATFDYLYPDVKWVSSFSDAPALSANGVLYAFANGSLVALDMATGHTNWISAMLDSWWAPAAIAPDGTVYAGDYGGSSVWAHDPVTGVKMWGFNVGVCVHSCPTLGVDGTLYLAGVKIYAVDPETHGEKWSFAGGSIFESSPALGADAVLYAGCYDGKMYALDARTGRKRWEFATGGLVHSSPALGADSIVYFGSQDGRLYALDGRTGQKRWDFASGGPISGSPVIGPDGCVYFGSEDNKVYALTATGEIKWSFVTGGRVTATPALTADGTLYISSPTGGLFALNSQTGEKLWQFPGGSATPAIGPDGTIYYGGVALYGTSPLADSPWPKFHRDANNRGRAAARPLLDDAQSRFTSEGFALIVYGEVGETVSVEWTANLRDWTPLHTQVNTTGRIEFFDPTASGVGQRFYRARRAE